MKRQINFLAIAATASLMMTSAQADEIALFDYACNINGATSVPTLGDAVPAGMDISGFDDIDSGTGTGLGRVDVTVTGAGAHSVICFFDHEIDEAANTFFNEAGETGGGALAAGQSWEIDEPGFVFGDIFDNLLAGALDDTNAVPAGFEDDVSMAIGFDFGLAAAETAIVSFFLDIINNAPGFFLHHFDPDSISDQLPAPNDIYFWANLLIRSDGVSVSVPEPGTLGLLGLGLIGMAIMRRRQRRQTVKV